MNHQVGFQQQFIGYEKGDEYPIPNSELLDQGYSLNIIWSTHIKWKILPKIFPSSLLFHLLLAKSILLPFAFIYLATVG